MAHKIVQRSGSWFKYDGTHLGQGKEKARNFLIENTDVSDEIKEKVLAAGGYAEPVPEEAIDDTAEAIPPADEAPATEAKGDAKGKGKSKK